MNGSTLKAKLQSIEPNLAEAARKLNMSKQAFYQALEVIDVKTGLVERLAAAYNKRISFFFSDSPAGDNVGTYAPNSPGKVVGNVDYRQNSESIAETIREKIEITDPAVLEAEERKICALEREIDHLREMLKEKDKTIVTQEAAINRLEKMNDFLMGQK